MGKVRVLASEIISKIAAGEVIERPASAVKELLENSLDAKATSIELYLKQAGKASIRIKDTGTGIEADDVKQIFLRHTTSKIQNIEDLYSIHSLGFRGEALYSIASIADVTLKSKPANQATGWQLHIRGNLQQSLSPMNMPQGTEIEIKELFFNTPARKKFLKSDQTELHQILQIFTPYTLLYPDCRFMLTHNDLVLLDLPSENNLLSRISRALHLPEKNLLEVKRGFPQENIKIHLVLGDINLPRANKDAQFFFVNRRPVQHRLLSYHLNQIYKLIFTDNSYPFFAVFIELNPQNLDVNVHPAKREVKIKDEQLLISLLRTLCEQTLMSSGSPKQIAELPSPLNKSYVPEQYLISEQNNIFEFKQEPFAKKVQGNLRDKLSKSLFIGTFSRLYLLFETDNSILIMDQHAAAERITYEKLKQQIDSGHIEIQQLTSPLVLRLTPSELILWEKIKEVLEKMGFTTTLWDKESIALHAHPQLITKPQTAIRAFFSEEDIPICDLDKLASLACKQSITAGYAVHPQEAEYLRTQLLKCLDPFTCPHGRPTLIELTEDVLLKQFLRG